MSLRLSVTRDTLAHLLSITAVAVMFQRNLNQEMYAQNTQDQNESNFEIKEKTT